MEPLLILCKPTENRSFVQKISSRKMNKPHATDTFFHVFPKLANLFPGFFFQLAERKCSKERQSELTD
jgi:hypothetical protein